MNTRTRIIRDLQETCMIADFTDFCNVASALKRGEDRDRILYEMPELERWPGVFSFLQQRI